MTTKPPRTQESKPTEHEKVVGWRFEIALRNAPEEVAELVAEATYVDLHRWERMVKNGCEPALALELLTPTE